MDNGQLTMDNEEHKMGPLKNRPLSQRAKPTLSLTAKKSATMLW